MFRAKMNYCVDIDKDIPHFTLAFMYSVDDFKTLEMKIILLWSVLTTVNTCRREHSFPAGEDQLDHGQIVQTPSNFCNDDLLAIMKIQLFVDIFFRFIAPNDDSVKSYMNGECEEKQTKKKIVKNEIE
jgi:hypothetical protein